MKARRGPRGSARGGGFGMTEGVGARRGPRSTIFSPTPGPSLPPPPIPNPFIFRLSVFRSIPSPRAVLLKFPPPAASAAAIAARSASSTTTRNSRTALPLPLPPPPPPSPPPPPPPISAAKSSTFTASSQNTPHRITSALSSRTLPGHAYLASARIASRETFNLWPPFLGFCSARNASTSSSTSPLLARKGGTSSVAPLNR